MEMADIVHQAGHGSKSDRLRAIAALEAFGAAAGDALVAALSDKNLEVRVAAASALGRVGGPQSVHALLEALRGPFTGGGGRHHQWKGVLWHLAMWPLGIALGWGLPLPVQIALAAGLLYLVLHPGLGHLLKRRQHEAFAGAVGQALEQIARRHPSGEVSTVVADLEAVAGNQVQQSSEAREAARHAAARIEALTGALRDLPVAAGLPEAAEGSVLPLPADALAEPAADNLPLPNTARAEAEPAVVRLQAGDSSQSP